MRRKIAWLESRLDQSETELSNLNQMLILCGFPEGIKTLKVTIGGIFEDAENFFTNQNPDDHPPTQAFDPFGC